MQQPLHSRCELMKISENSAEELPVPAEQGASGWPVPPQPVAPWWHTAIVIAVILGVSVVSSTQAKASALAQHHMQHYAFTMVWEIALGVLTWWGIRMRRVPIRQLLGERRAGVKAWFTDFGVALIFWLMASVVLAAISSVLRVLHLLHGQKAVLCDRATDRMGSAGVGCALGHGRHCRRICISRLFAAAGRIDQRKIDGPRKLVARRTHVFAALRRGARL